MKNTPERIYLQIGDEYEIKDFNEAEEVSWCADKIYDSDIEYVRVIKRLNNDRSDT